MVVAVSLDDAASRDEVERTAGQLPAGMQVWIGATQDDLQRLGLGAAIPVTLVLDTDGRVAHRERGSLGPGSLDQKIERLLGRKGGREPAKKPFGGVEAIRGSPAPQEPGRSL